MPRFCYSGVVKIRSHPPQVRVPAPGPTPARPTEPPPVADQVSRTGGQPPGGPQSPSEVVAWHPLKVRPRAFGEGLTSSLLMAVCGPIAVAVSKVGEGIDKLGQKMGWWEGIGTLKKPLPPSLLGDLPGARMERPMLVVPGWQTPQDRFDHLVAKLTQDGANGGQAYFVSNGEFFSDIQCTQSLKNPGKDARVFVAVFPKTNTPPDQSAPELARSLEAIQKFTGQGKVDVTGYSMGGQATRVYLDQGGEAVGKFMMLGTPNHGSSLSRTSLGLLDLQDWGFDTSWLLARKPISEEDRAALGWLLPVDGNCKNPQLSDLNTRWEAQKARTEAVRLVGSHSRFTLGRYFLPNLGDGTVTSNSLCMPGEQPHHLKDSRHRNHGLLFSNPQTYLEMHDFFGWGSSSVR